MTLDMILSRLSVMKDGQEKENVEALEEAIAIISFLQDERITISAKKSRFTQGEYIWFIHRYDYPFDYGMIAFVERGIVVGEWKELVIVECPRISSKPISYPINDCYGTREEAVAAFRKEMGTADFGTE